ncbi:hypothetical protein HK098_004432 [Nowakowskiella sp. JEL0407]|nr:hypothetical protein HK098_004432 [Nowakowskiella sp. JEL0407]
MQIARMYSPITYTKYSFDVLVKKYPDGFLSNFLFSKKPGDKVEIRGVFSTLPTDYQKNQVKNLGLIAGGTGITPFYQIIKKVLGDEEDTTKVWLLYANKSEEDILLKRELDLLALAYPDKFSVKYVVDRTDSKDWKGFKGYMNEKMVKESIPAPNEDVTVLVCGPDQMIAHVAGKKTEEYEQGRLEGVLKRAGFNERKVWKL